MGMMRGAHRRNGGGPDRTVVRARVRQAYRERMSATQRSVVIAWGAFTATFGVTRAITYTLHREGAGGSGGIAVGGRHIHHYNFGIAALFAVGAVAVRGDERLRRHPATAAAYGGGVALVVDELALLVDLKDVYWAKDGRRSVDVAGGLIGLTGLYLAGQEFWHAAGRALLAGRREQPDRPAQARPDGPRASGGRPA
ncbi:hypothetical protein [Amycolatopsis sp. PS_44_ISF1]|uniref:hypothetical protein n=1 Tax=Amycolatopsis sp. PS_44_ISF1 TaxID=2974917 RepID=UPI0028DF391E|nr:hypothetical protein [Amycolatopsis sp. PS_44_ISF1]MDT8915148.1 hypothetical protein [Amycolatopsis sp. PS_44_ISF1]